MPFRSVHVILENRISSDVALKKTGADLDHGQWTIEPADLVGDQDNWGSESSDLSILTGTEGRVTFTAPGLALHLHWNSPAFGDPSYDASVDPPGRADGSGFSVGFYGPTRFNDEAEVTFVLLPGKATVNGDTGEISLTPPSPWRRSVPSAGHALAATHSSPTSWYTTPENIQHIAYVGIDRQIHECFFRIGGRRGWEHSIPSAGHALVADGTSPTSWYTTPENVQHIAYVGVDGQIHECFFRIGGTRTWEHSIPSAGHPPVAPRSSPTSWYTTPENIQHIAYVGDDRLIHECFFRIGGTRGWEHSVPGEGHTHVLAGTSPTSWYTTPANVQHIAYTGADRRVHHCFFFVGGFGGWQHETCNPGAADVADLTSPTSWYTTPENIQHVAYVGTDGRMHECFFLVRADGDQTWHQVTLPGPHPLSPRTQGTGPTSWYTTPENVQHVAYVGTNHLIHELFFHIGGTAGWQHLAPNAGQALVAVDSSPTSWYTTPENIQHLAYVGVDQQIHELFFLIR